MDLRDAERLIEESDNHRLLRRVPPLANWPLPAAQGDVVRAVFVDCETTGLDHDRDEVIELALLPFDYERESGRIVAVLEERALAGFREPSFPIPAEAEKIHGVTNAMVKGAAIAEAIVRPVVEPAQLIIAHNAAFDRPMLEKHWPVFAEKHWACSLAEIGWRSEGLSSSKLDYLLWAQGWFHDGHRALSDAAAALFLMTLPLPITKKPALLSLLECARRPLWAVRAADTVFEQRAALKARGYRWDDGQTGRSKAWWILTNDPQVELDWLKVEIYGDERDITVVKAPATRRYSGRLWVD